MQKPGLKIYSQFIWCRGFDMLSVCLCPVCEGLLEGTTMYADELFNKGLTPLWRQVFSFCCHNFCSLYMVVLCDLAVEYERTVSYDFSLIILIFFASRDPSP
jgi:hypothetical protein